jgi:hypothetical protein
VDPNLAVRTVVSGLEQPVNIGFLKKNDFLVTEKATGKVKRVVNGVVTATVLDLPVNSASERGLLGLALHPKFKENHFVYLYWTESSTGADSTVLAEVGNPNSPFPPGTLQPLGNRVDRFVWDANTQTLTFDRNLITLRAYQADTGQPLRGNHDGGVLAFERRHRNGDDDGGEEAESDRVRKLEVEDTSDDDDWPARLFIMIGDNGRRGQMQNLPDGPGPGGNLADDQFGGPEPDNAHLTGVILRLNDDGSTPTDNPFYVAGALRGGEAGANLQKVFAYGIRNGFGIAVDPFSGHLWDAQNGDDSFSEVNRIEPGANLGWVQIMGPLERLAEFKAIETNVSFFGLQQIRWSPTNIADTTEELLERLFVVYEGGNAFGTTLTGRQEVPVAVTDASATLQIALNANGTLTYELRATGPIVNATAAHIHLGGPRQNGPVVLFLFSASAPQNFQAGDVIGSGTVDDTDVIARPGFVPSIANLVDRIRQGRTYANLHTVLRPGGEIRGQVFVNDRAPVSYYSDPQLSWRYEVAPAAVGFVAKNALGREYYGDLIVGAARPLISNGHLFRLQLSRNRNNLVVDDVRLTDGVADNLAKYDITESESLLFGTGFGVSTDIKTGPGKGNLFIVSLSNGAVYEIYRAKKQPRHDD